MVPCGIFVRVCPRSRGVWASQVTSASFEGLPPGSDLSQIKYPASQRGLPAILGSDQKTRGHAEHVLLVFVQLGNLLGGRAHATHHCHSNPKCAALVAFRRPQQRLLQQPRGKFAAAGNALRQKMRGPSPSRRARTDLPQRVPKNPANDMNLNPW